MLTFFFSPLKRRWTACQRVQTMDEKQTEFVSEVFSFTHSQSLMWKCLSNHPQTHQLLCFKWRLKFSAFQESHSKGWNSTIPLIPSAGGCFIRTPRSPSQRWRNRQRFFAGQHTSGKSRSIRQVSWVTSEMWLKSVHSRVRAVMQGFMQGLLGCTLQYDNG